MKDRNSASEGRR